MTKWISALLQARHIPEPDEATMTRLEARMAAEELNRLSALNSDIRALSRRNTNVRSLALSLGHKRVLTASV